MFDNLDIHYKYWDDYIRKWCFEKISDKYLPEPWWGWTPDSKEPLHSVVINMNPGVGGKLQTHRCMNCMWGCLNSTKYSESMDLLRLHLAPTERWHLTRRFRPLMRTHGVPEKKIAPTTRHHLSIELSPEHGQIDFTGYLKKYANEIYDHVLCFAAKASKLIEPNPYSIPEENLPHENPLKNIVLMRCAPEHINTLNEALSADKMINKEYSFTEPEEYLYKDNTDKKDKIKAAVFTMEIKDVLFVCIPGVRNNFPGKDNLQKILNYIHSNKNNKK